MNPAECLRNVKSMLPLLACAALLSCGDAGHKSIPLDVLFGNPVNTRPRISPDGKKLAYLAPHRGVLNVFVRDLGRANGRPVTRDTLQGIGQYFWAGDGRQILYLQDRDGNENFRLFGVDVASGKTRDYTPFPDVQVRVLDEGRGRRHEALLLINKTNPAVHDVYRLDLSTGGLTLDVKNPGDVVDWAADTALTVRAALAALPDGGLSLRVRDSNRTGFRELLAWTAEDNFSSGLVGLSADGRTIFCVDSRDANAGRLVKISLDDGRPAVLAEDPRYDVGEVVVHPETREVQAVSFLKTRTEWRVLDTAVKEDFAAIGRADHGDFSLVDRDRADHIWIIAFSRDNGPRSYYAYDRGKKETSFLFDRTPALRAFVLSDMTPMIYEAADGRTIHGYITFPPDRGRKRLPLVLNVHGGPWSRHAWGYDPVAQWLANRGVICLQVNFRGSSGYGKDFLNLGNRQWGADMIRDLADAASWAVRHGYADSSRMAVFGRSFGGFAALAASAFYPGLFACAVDVSGPSNLVSWIKNAPPYWEPFKDILYKRVGHPDKDREMLEKQSPLFNARNIKRPLFIAQGLNDPRVPPSESEQIVRALKANKVPCEYLSFPDEGHVFEKPENRLKFYAAAEKFLAKHLSNPVPRR